MNWYRWIYAMRARARAIVGSHRVERDLDDELAFHVAMQTRTHLQNGLRGDEARRRAHHALGGVEQAKERCRDARPWGWAHDLIRDLAYASRSLRRTPGFSVVPIAGLGRMGLAGRF